MPGGLTVAQAFLPEPFCKVGSASDEEDIMHDDRKTTTDANHRIARGDPDETASPRPPARSDVAEANQRISRDTDQHREQPLQREQALRRPPD